MQSLLRFKLLIKHTWVSESGCGCSHDSRDQRVGFTEGWVGHMQPLDCNTIQGGVVQDHHSISIQREALEGQQGVVWLNHHITCLILVWKDTARAAVHFRGPQSRIEQAKSMYHLWQLPHEGHIGVRLLVVNADVDQDQASVLICASVCTCMFVQAFWGSGH